MKKVLIRLLIACAPIVLAGCSAGVGKDTLSAMNLKGNISSVKSAVFEVVDNGGVVVKGAPVDHARMNRTYRFDEEGFVTSEEHFSGGDITAWEDYAYGADRRLESIDYHSIYHGRDNTARYEWLNDTDYIRTGYNENGEKVSEDIFTRNRNSSERLVTGPGESRVIFRTWYRNDRPVRNERLSGDRTIRMEYGYDSKGNESVIRNYMDGEPYGKVEMEYTAYDSAGNWTSRISYVTDQTGLRSPYLIEERIIEYYSVPVVVAVPARF